MKNVRIMFTGDSVTDCGHGRPIGEGVNGLGEGWVNTLNLLLFSDFPQNKVRIQNSAISGDTTRKLLKRYITDVVDYKPDYIFILIGINDCWRDLDNPLVKESQISLEEYESNMRQIIALSREAGIEPVIITPYFIELNKEHPMRKKCDEIIKILYALSKEFSIGIIDLQDKMDEYVKAGGSDYMLSADRVHPARTAVYLIARTVYAHPVFRNIIGE